MDATSAVGSDMVPVAVAVQPPFSVAVTVYVPAVKPVIVAVDAPLFQTYVVGFVPPVADAVRLPSLPPLQLALLFAVTDALKLLPPVILCESDSVQPLASVTVTVYVSCSETPL